MQKGNKTAVDYYIVFTESDLKHWIMKWLHPGIQHVYAIKKSIGGHFWIVINPLNSYTDVNLYSVDEYPHARCIVGDEAVLLPVKSFVDLQKPRYTLCVFNCVEVVKSLLGIRKPWVFTPFQLYKYLVG